jgi:hypothetical protein
MITLYQDPETFDTTYYISFIPRDEKATAFIPTNTALAANPIPEGTDTLQFIRYHFIEEEIIMDDGKVSGNFRTTSFYGMDEGVEYAELEIQNQPDAMSVTDRSGNTINVSHEKADNIVQKAVIHKIDDFFRLE